MSIDDDIADAILHEEMYAAGSNEGIIIYEHDKMLKERGLEIKAGNVHIRTNKVLTTW